MGEVHPVCTQSYRNSRKTHSRWSAPLRNPRARSRRRLISFWIPTEQLEGRHLLSTAQIAIPATSATPMASSATPTGLTPAQLRAAYGLNNITFANGSIVGDGSGQTIAIVVAYDNPYIASDLQRFNQQYGLPDANLRVIKQTASMPTNGGWGLETALDVQWAHAIAPGANILLLEAKSDSLSDLITMVNRAKMEPDVVTVSMSWGMNEFAGERNYNSTFTTPPGHQGITYVAASGDNGAWLGASFPAISPNVLGVGGTQLFVSSDGTYQGETSWSGSGGGFSTYLAEPGYQYSAQSSGLRTSPDVSWNAAVASGVSVYSTLSDSGSGGWFTVGGTSAGTPAWAAIIAIADQGRALNGSGSLAGAQSLIYSLPSSAFRDITTGRNGYSAGPGYDVVTGLGSPYVDRVVAGLVSLQNSGSGNYVAAASPQRVRRLHRLRARRHDEVLTSPGEGSSVSSGGSAFSSSPNSGSNVIEVTTINANQAIIIVVSRGNGRIIEELFAPIQNIDIATITGSQAIAPITASLLSGINTQPEVERIGQGDDPTIESTEIVPRADESPLPSLTDSLGRRNLKPGKASGLTPIEEIPADLVPQDPPAAPPSEHSTPRHDEARPAEIITEWVPGLGLEWFTDPFAAEVSMSPRARNRRGDAGGGDLDVSADASVFTAAIAVLGGNRLMREGGLRTQNRTGPPHDSSGRVRGNRRDRRGVNPFRYLLER